MYMLTPTNLLVMCYHRGMHKGGGVQYVYIEGVWGHATEIFLVFYAMRELLVQSEASMQG